MKTMRLSECEFEPGIVRRPGGRRGAGSAKLAYVAEGEMGVERIEWWPEAQSVLVTMDDGQSVMAPWRSIRWAYAQQGHEQPEKRKPGRPRKVAAE